MELGTNIKKIRELKNYTQEYVAHALGISQGYYNKIENNQSKLSVERLTQIAAIFEMDLSQLMTFEDASKNISDLPYQDQIQSLKNQLADLTSLVTALKKAQSDE